jgi:type IV pilus assembly protein PilN
MIRINLLPVKEIKAEIGRRQELVVAGLCLGVTVFLILALHLFQSYRLSSLRAEADNLKKEIEALNVKLKEAGDLQQKVKALQQKVKLIDDLKKKKVGPVRIMETLSSAVPARLWLTEFKEASGSLTISGMAVDNQTVAEFLKALSASPYFANVDLVETTQIEQDGVSLKKFSLKSQIFYQPAPAPGQKGNGALKTSSPKEEKKS